MPNPAAAGFTPYLAPPADACTTGIRRSGVALRPTWPARLAVLACVGLVLACGGCGETPRLIAPPPEDARGGSPREMEAAALYACGLAHAWSGEYGQALAELHQSDRLAPEQPLILAAIGFALDDLAHPEDTAHPAGTTVASPENAPLRREELEMDAYGFLFRAANLNSDDPRVYERLAAHWFRYSRRPVPPLGVDAAEFRADGESQSAHYSLLALRRLAVDTDSDLARQKSMVYITHLGKYYRQMGLLSEELEVVRIHRWLEPTDLGLQLDEIELLYLTRQVTLAENRLAAFQAQNGKPLQANGPLNSSASSTGTTPAISTGGGPLQRRINWARMLGRRVQAALRADSDWPHNPGDANATASSAQLRWLDSEPGPACTAIWLSDYDALVNLFWQDFEHLQRANPLAPGKSPGN